MSLETVSKRFFVTLPDGIGEALDRWAQAEKNKPATLAAYLLEQAIRQAQDQGKVPQADSISATPAEDLMERFKSVCESKDVNQGEALEEAIRLWIEDQSSDRSG